MVSKEGQGESEMRTKEIRDCMGKVGEKTVESLFIHYEQLENDLRIAEKASERRGAMVEHLQKRNEKLEAALRGIVQTCDREAWEKAWEALKDD